MARVRPALLGCINEAAAGEGKDQSDALSEAHQEVFSISILQMLLERSSSYADIARCRINGRTGKQDREVRMENKPPSRPFLPLNTLGGLHLPSVLQNWHLGADWLVQSLFFLVPSMLCLGIAILGI